VRYRRPPCRHLRRGLGRRRGRHGARVLAVAFPWRFTPSRDRHGQVTADTTVPGTCVSPVDGALADAGRFAAENVPYGETGVPGYVVTRVTPAW